MANDLTIQGARLPSKELQRSLKTIKNGMVTADNFLSKKYLGRLKGAVSVPLSAVSKEPGHIAIEKITKIVYDKNENVNEKFISVLTSIRDNDSAVFFIIDSKSNGTDFYIGVRNEVKGGVPVSKEVLRKSFLGNFPGSEIESLDSEQIDALVADLPVIKRKRGNSPKSVACVSVLPSTRNDDSDKFVQGMEKFIDTMIGNKYTAIFLAKPLGKCELETIKRGYEEMYAAISPHSKTTLSYGMNTSDAVTNGTSTSFSESINNSVTNTTGTGTSTSHGTNSGSSSGNSFSIFQGYSTNSGRSEGVSDSYTSSQNWSNSATTGQARTTGSTDNQGRTMTTGDTRSITVEHHNKSVEEMLARIEDQLKNIKEWEAFGIYDAAAYFISDDNATCLVAANAYRALMSGKNTFNETSYLSFWSGSEELQQIEQLNNVLDYASHFAHPVFKVKGEDGFNLRDRFVTTGNFVCGKDLPIFMGLPRKSVNGLTVTSMAEFGRNVHTFSKSDGKSVRLGCIKHMGRNEDTPVNLDLDSFTSHCFVTGSTGSGKSNTTYLLLNKCLENKVKFLVVEPAKGEYKNVFAGVEGINIFTSNPLYGRLLKLNPFRFPNSIHVLEHLDRLIEIFNACWDMEAAMPAFLKEAVERSYLDKGWDLINSRYIIPGVPQYPTFQDLLASLNKVIEESSYSKEVKGNYTGSLVTRVSSLSNGIIGEMFNASDDVDDPTLFDNNCIVDLSRIGSAETKSLIMGVLILKLNEYRIANASETNVGLRHVTVLEEAHNILRRTSGESGKLASKSVEMITNSIAEMRTYGEGFIIVDQSPTAVDIAAIKNTNTKIIMRLPERGDCEAVGNAAGLNEEQIKEITRLPKGAAVVMQNNWIDAVLCQIDYCPTGNVEPDFVTQDDLFKFRNDIIAASVRAMIGFVPETLKESIILNAIEKSTVCRSKKEEYKHFISTYANMINNENSVVARELLIGKMLLELSQTESMFVSFENVVVVKGGTVDEDSERRWFVSVINSLKQYISLNDAPFKTVFRYILIAVADKRKKPFYERLKKTIRKKEIWQALEN